VTFNEIPPPNLALTAGAQPKAIARLRLYIARSTPNSVRAQHNLSIALVALEGSVPPEVEVIDVFSQPKRAIIDGVVVTPTLVATTSAKRLVLMGDLADLDQLQRTLREFLEA
jgi:circadian clock protein KaiB